MGTFKRNILIHISSIKFLIYPPLNRKRGVIGDTFLPLAKRKVVPHL